MKIADVKQIVLTELTPFAEEHGLKVKKGDFSLCSKRGQNPSIEIFFLYNTWGFEVELFPMVSINFKEIHDICDACGVNLSYEVLINLILLEEIQKHGWDPDVKWHMQMKRIDRIHLVDGEEWIDKFRETMSRLCPLAIDYINRYSTLEALDKLYNQFPIDIHNPNTAGGLLNCIVGLIIAKLVNNPDYEELKRIYGHIMKEAPMGPGKDINWLPPFPHIVKYLDNMPVQKRD